ncbi:MAG: histidinol-phosphate transaminase [Acidobacteria bacterium]|nr:MAG: histidinol-phosphate transaminase [Acidobacteriota bacterium]
MNPDWRQDNGGSRLEGMTRTIEDLIPDYLRSLPVYVPGKPIEEVERELKIHAVKLASNENPLGPSPKAIAAARAVLGDSNRYPDGGTYALRQTLAERRGVSPQEIFVGLGSSEIIDLAARVLLRAGLQGLTSEGTYAPFSVAIRASGAELVLVPQRHFAFDLKAMANAITPKTGVIYLANPNNPTGSAFRREEFDEFLAVIPDDVVVVLDEAYIHYAVSMGLRESVEAYRKRKNLLILRTFSKVYGLAGLRIGYAIGMPELLSAMNKLKTPFNTSGVAQAAALAALDDKEHVTRCIETNARERKRLSEDLAKMGFQPVPSEANFVFIVVGPDAKALSDDLLQMGVIVRPLGWMGFPEAIRISVGTAEENDRCLSVMARVILKRAGKGELAVR